MTEFHPSYLLNAFAYAAIGLLLFLAAFAIFDRVAPFRLWREVVEEKNVAVAILVGLVGVGMAIIIAAAFH